MCDLTAPEFQDEDTARRHVEANRWPDGPVCPHCGSMERIYPIEPNPDRKIRKGLYKCGEKECGKSFTVTVGTVFENSRVPLKKWLLAIHLMCSSKKGISSHQLHRSLGVTYKTAWFMAHRIREAFREDNPEPLGGGGSTVEVDETFWGNKKKKGDKKGRGYAHKEKVFTLVERGGRARSFHVPSVSAKTLRPIMREQIKADTHIMTDEASQYCQKKEPMTADFESHSFVTHGIGEYVRGDIHTNTIESYFAILKRGLNGVFHHVGQQHLRRYISEFDFRYNYRAKLGFSDKERAAIALNGIEGKRLKYAN